LSYLFVVLLLLTSLAIPVHAASAPDLTVENIWLEDASQPGQPISQVSPGQSFLIVATIKNIGQVTASGYYVDVYYDSDYGRGGPDNIAAGEVQIWYVGPLTAQAGTHTTKWVADPDNQIAELDETNNQKEYTFTVGSQTTNGLPTVSDLKPDKASPQVVGATVTWRSSASDPEGDSILYRFWLQSGSGAWVVTQDWSSSNSWSWSPNVAGTYNVGVWVRDGKHASSTGYDARLIVNGYSITSAPPNGLPTVSDLKPDKASPQQVGTVITWSCSANDPEGDSISYRFWLQAGSSAWVITQDWSSSSTWSWTPSAAGTFNVGCWVRDGKHAGPTGFDDRKIVYGYVVTTASASIQPPSSVFSSPSFVSLSMDSRVYCGRISRPSWSGGPQ
jgi:hypothetical protein